MPKAYFSPMYFEWIDSTMRKTVWVNAAELVEETNNVQDTFKTLAYLVNENKLEYICASSIHFDGGGIASYGQIFTIPKGCVIKKRKIKNHF